MQQAVYDTVLLRRRTEIHAVMADFLERLHPERVEDIADHHLSARQKERALPVASILIIFSQRLAGFHG